MSICSTRLNVCIFRDHGMVYHKTNTINKWEIWFNQWEISNDLIRVFEMHIGPTMKMTQLYASKFWTEGYSSNVSFYMYELNYVSVTKLWSSEAIGHLPNWLFE